MYFGNQLVITAVLCRLVLFASGKILRTQDIAGLYGYLIWDGSENHPVYLIGLYDGGVAALLSENAAKDLEALYNAVDVTHPDVDGRCRPAKPIWDWETNGPVYACIPPSPTVMSLLRGKDKELSAEVDAKVPHGRGYSKLLKQMRTAFHKWYKAASSGTRPKLVGSDSATEYASEMSYENRDEKARRWHRLVLAVYKMNGWDYIDADVVHRIVRAVFEWTINVKVTPEFDKLLSQMVSSTGLAQRHTWLPDWKVEVLISAAAGRHPGFSTTDLSYSQGSADIQSYVLGIGRGDINPYYTQRAYIFVVNSMTGRFLPFVGTTFVSHELVFSRFLAGDFQLLGYDKLYGRRAAHAHLGKRSSAQGHLAVFYFDEVIKGSRYQLNEKALKSAAKGFSPVTVDSFVMEEMMVHHDLDKADVAAQKMGSLQVADESDGWGTS